MHVASASRKPNGHGCSPVDPQQMKQTTGEHSASCDQLRTTRGREVSAGDPSPAAALAHALAAAASALAGPSSGGQGRAADRDPARRDPLDGSQNERWLAGGSDHGQRRAAASCPNLSPLPSSVTHLVSFSPSRNHRTAQIDRPRPLIASISHCRAIRTIAKGAPFRAAPAAALAAAAGSAVAPRPERCCVAAGRVPAGDVARRRAGGS
ncbi:Uncharacterized protein TPAR_04900 [Tolypocladium paradoxum]|uniref:Uncharacterized protein n=1 Tax=Tolypocladium paradoxum TaxID=94208 RepID=A0A2S4KXK7_9HYPO|nr:Uncharacterized protein TPAR_04900 [Tolypocladium paradoxum]